MSIPIVCQGCGSVVGEDSSMAGLFSDFGAGVYAGECPGKGNHAAPERIETETLFGLAKRVTVTYPATHTSSSWYEYTGPKKPFVLWLTLMLISDDGIVVDGQWCWWRPDIGFYGDGYKSFQKA